MKAQDTSELFFDNVRVPADNLLGGGTGMGFIQLMQQLPQERLVIAIQAIAAIEAAMEHTIAYVKERKAFGKPIIDFQNTRFKLAELKTKAHGRARVRRRLRGAASRRASSTSPPPPWPSTAPPTCSAS